MNNVKLDNKKFLICHPFLYEINGATNVALELAIFLKKNGAHVTLYTNILENPIKEYCDKNNLHVDIAIDNPQYHLKDFDYVWINSQTFPISLLHELSKKSNKSLPKFIFMHMSAHDYCPDEMPYIYGFEEKLSSLSLFVSEEAFEKNKKNYEKLPHNINFYRNPAPTSYGKIKRTNKADMPKKLLVVDNSPCNELLELHNLLKEKNIQIDYLGKKGNRQEIINNKIIQKYDGVITIGKTVQYCLVSETPVYVYGSFGGPGWLNNDNISLARQKNFSGRGFKQKNPALIAQELINGYQEANLFYQKNKSTFINEYLIDNILPSIIQQANKDKKMNKVFSKAQIESLTNLLRLITVSFIWRYKASYKEQIEKDYFELRTSIQKTIIKNDELAKQNSELLEIVNSRSVQTWLKFNNLIKRKKPQKPEVILVMCIYNEARNMKLFLKYIEKYIDGIVVVDDNSSDNTRKILKKSKKILSIIKTDNPHTDNSYDERKMREQAIKETKKVAKTPNPFVLCIDPDERPEKRFLRNLHDLAIKYNKQNKVITLHYRELWGNIDTWRKDGIWGEKIRPLFFQLNDNMSFSFKHQYHVPWAYDEIVNNQELLDYNIYHLKMIKEQDRENRKNLYNSLDPNREIQHIGYDYLNNKEGLKLQKISSKHKYDFRSVPKYYKDK